jgi:hypothetical protein
MALLLGPPTAATRKHDRRARGGHPGPRPTVKSRRPDETHALATLFVQVRSGNAVHDYATSAHDERSRRTTPTPRDRLAASRTASGAMLGENPRGGTNGSGDQNDRLPLRVWPEPVRRRPSCAGHCERPRLTGWSSTGRVTSTANGPSPTSGRRARRMTDSGTSGFSQHFRRCPVWIRPAVPSRHH